jgi:hypothetical protein
MKDNIESKPLLPVANILKEQTYVRVVCHKLMDLRVYFLQFYYP